MSVDVTPFEAGGISNSLMAWQEITTDARLLAIVDQGYKIEFVDLPPCQLRTPFQIFCNSKDIHNIDYEISKLLNLGVLQIARSCSDQFLSDN